MALPESTVLYSAHEYTLANAKFALTVDPDNKGCFRTDPEPRDTRQQQQQEQNMGPFCFRTVARCLCLCLCLFLLLFFENRRFSELSLPLAFLFRNVAFQNLPFSEPSLFRNATFQNHRFLFLFQKRFSSGLSLLQTVSFLFRNGSVLAFLSLLSLAFCLPGFWSFGHTLTVALTVTVT
jgi:hypothetical protein